MYHLSLDLFWKSLVKPLRLPTSAWRNTDLIIKVKWQQKNLIATSYPKKIVYTKTNEYTRQMKRGE